MSKRACLPAITDERFCADLLIMDQVVDALVFNSRGVEADQARTFAKELGRRGGLKGGKVRAKRLSAKRRSEIARKAARARWDAARRRKR